MKKIIVLLIIICQLVLSCSSDGSSNNLAGLSSDIDAILAQPYSKLSSAEQKVKLEAEANAMLAKLNITKTSGAIEAIQNLGKLLSISPIDIFKGKNDNQIAEILNVSGVYGIYTWSVSRQNWFVTASSTELKIIFPAKINGTTNNATLSSNSTSSTIKVEIEDTYGNWVYNPITYNYEQTPSIFDEIYLPNSVDATLNIDNVQVATFAAKAAYSGTKETPDTSSFKMILKDGYTWEINASKGENNSAISSLTYLGKNLINMNFNSSAKIDLLLEDNNLNQYLGKANGLFQIMDNFMIVANMDIEGLSNDQDISNQNTPYPDYYSSTYYSDLNTYYKNESNDAVAAFNRNIKMALVSKIDGTKIADIIERSEKDYSYYSYSQWNNNYGGYWEGIYPDPGVLIQHYTEVPYLRFGDQSEAEMESYFLGFSSFKTNVENYLKAFER